MQLILYSNVLKNSTCLKTLRSPELHLYAAAPCGTQIRPVLPKQRHKNVSFVAKKIKTMGTSCWPLVIIKSIMLGACVLIERT